MHLSDEKLKEIIKRIGIDLSRYDLSQLRKGVNVELEHGTRDAQTNITNDDPIATVKIAIAHLNEIPDYYDRLEKMETEAGL